jgi:type I restriction enzyme S subunit
LKFKTFCFYEENFRKRLIGVSTISANTNINQNSLKKLKIIIPPTKTEQATIANALSDVDGYIESLEKLIAKKQKIKQGAMQQLLKPKPHWEIKSLKEIARYRRGSFPQPYGLEKWYDDINGAPFVQVFDVDDNKLLKSETKCKISREAQEMSIFVKKGSIILTIQGSIGRIAITQYDSYVDRTLLIFESFLEKFDKYFFMISVWIIFEHEKESAPGGIIKTITKESLSSFKISFPTYGEQMQIAQTLTDIDSEITTLNQKLTKAKDLKQGMMQQLLTGKIRLL